MKTKRVCMTYFFDIWPKTGRNRAYRETKIGKRIDALTNEALN
jgi:hypothetical protein